ncbi:MAG: RND transporter [Methylotenera sp.]|nr:RND transporter [Oligoflexia bacterium]
MNKISWPAAVVGCLTLGLAPFTPPHLVEKIQLLSLGKLSKTLDVFDLFFHLMPWLVLVLKIPAAKSRQVKSENTR